MTASDDLSKLSVRAKEAEGRVTAAPEKAKADLEEDLEFTRTAVEKQNAVLPELVSESKGRMSDRWHDLQAAWNEAISPRGDREPQGRARPAQGGGAGRQGGGGRPVRDRLRLLGDRRGRVRRARRGSCAGGGR